MYRQLRAAGVLDSSDGCCRPLRSQVVVAMTVDELIAYLKESKRQGILRGDTPVVWNSLSHSWDVIPTVTTRNGKTVLVVNT